MADLSPMLKEIVAAEPDAMAWTNEVAEPFVVYAQNAFEIFATGVTDSIKEGLLFRGAYTHTRTMAGLAVLSALRQHRIENGLNLRQVIEGTCLLGYLAAHPGVPKDMSQPDMAHADLINANERVLKTAMAWVTATHPGIDGDLRFYKSHINRNRSHTTVFATASVYDYTDKDGYADQRFFDAHDPLETRATLMATGNIINLASGMLILSDSGNASITLGRLFRQSVKQSVELGTKLRALIQADYVAAGR